MIPTKYAELMDKIRITGNYIDDLEKLKDNMYADVEKNELDIEVQDILIKCIADINKLYINHECGAVNTKEVIDGYNQEPKLTDDYRPCNDEYKAKLNEENKIDIKVYRSDNLDKKSSK